MATSSVKRLHHRHGERGGAARRLGERGGIVERGVAGLDDDGRELLRDQAGVGGGLRQRRLEAQHVAQGGEVGEGLGGERRGAKGVDQAAGHLRRPCQTSKKTVSFGPPRWIGSRQTPAVAPGDQRGAARRLDQLQHGILGQRRIAVEIDSRRQPVEDAAGKDRDVDVRRLQAAHPAAIGPRHAAGPHGGEARHALGVGRGAAEAVEARVEGQVAAIVGMVVAAVAVGLPDLDQAVGHEGAPDVVQAERELDALAGDAGRGEVGAAGLDQGAPVERADGLRRRELGG